MKKIVLIFLLSLAFNIWSQSKDSTTYRKFDIGLSFSPDYSYRILKTDVYNTWLKEIYDTLEVPKYGYTAGLNCLFRINKNIFIGSGLLLVNKGERTKKYLVQPANNYTSHYYYVDVPLKLNYFLLQKGVKLFITLGLSANLYISSKYTTVNGGYGVEEPLEHGLEISPVNFSFIGGAGIDLPATERWYFRLEPNYRRSITPISSAPLKKYFYSLGLNLGIFCKL